MNLRGRLAIAAGKLAGKASQIVGLGSGGMIGGRVALNADPRILRKLSATPTIVLVSGTNGKSTTTGLVRVALEAEGEVASNVNGDNMPPGIVTALVNNPEAKFAVLEVDEMYLPRVARQTRPDVMVLLNLSRDQLDRVGEVKQVASRLRKAVDENPQAHIVANCDDPLIVCAAWDAPNVTWVAAGSTWGTDPASFPRGGGQITRQGDDWWVKGEHSYRRPEPDWWVEDQMLVNKDGVQILLQLALPGKINRFNAAQALAAVGALGIDPGAVSGQLQLVRDVAGRYQSYDVDGRRVLLMLAKNPAGWQESLEILSGNAEQVVLSVNGQVGDGQDLSWLWDVDFGALRDRPGTTVIASGERGADLQVRLDYAGVENRFEVDPLSAVLACRPGKVSVLANYTAMQDLLSAIKSGGYLPVMEGPNDE